MRIRLHYKLIVDYYLLYFHYIVTIASKLDGNGSAIKNIPPLEELKSILIPLPPINEQNRIINQIEYVYGLVDLIASGKKLKAPKPEPKESISVGKVIPIPVISDKPKFDVNTLKWAARADSDVSEEELESAKRQVENV
jgi:type I restriction enzyme S subunit